MERTLALAMWFQVVAGSLAAQNEAALRSYFEGKTVQVKLAMPAAEAGVDVYPGASPPIDYSTHAKRLKKYGIALEAGQSALVTRLKVKGSLIEFQLDGGGYGTSGDPTDPTVAVAAVPKSQRENDLEAALKTETDAGVKRRLERELDQLRTNREWQDRRNQALAASATERRREYIQNRRLQGGSRFNLRYPKGVPPQALQIETVRAALDGLVSFELPPAPTDSTPAEPAGLLALRKGLLVADVDSLLGAPMRRTNGKEGTLAVTNSTYETNGELVKADFVEDVLVRYAVTPR